MYGLAFLIAVITFVMAIVALNKIAKLQTAVFKLGKEIESLKASGLERARLAAPDQQSLTSEQPAAVDIAEGEQKVPEASEGEPMAAGDSQVSAQSSEARPARDMEQALAGRWFVWIGGVAIAIGGLLFVKYAYDNGLLSPVTQIVLGIAAGLVLVMAGDWLGRRSSATEDQSPNYVPAALSAAGLAVLFAAVYAAYALYQIIAPTTAFLGLAAVGLGAMALSRRQGPFIAALGLLGSYVTPALIPSADPSAWSFFPYLLIIYIASMLTLRGRTWWWLGFAAVGGTLLWCLLWLYGPFEKPDVLPIGLTALVMGVAAMLLLEGRSMFRDEAGSLAHPGAMRPALAVGVMALAAGTAVLILQTLHENRTDESLSLLAAGLALLLLFAWLKHGLALFAPAAAMVMLTVLASWRGAAFHAWTLDEYGLWSWSNGFGLESQRYLRWMLGSGAAFTLAGVAGVLWRPRTAAWGALGGGAAVLFLFAAWARTDFLMADPTWALMAAGAAAFLLLAVLVWNRRMSEDDHGAGLLALGAAALLVMALDRMLDGVWLTLSIAGMALFFALLSGILKPRLMGPVTAGLAGLAALRLFVSREIWNDDQSLPWGEHWVVYGYGLPAVLFYAASRLVRRGGHERSAAALEGISLALLISLASLEIRVLIAGGITYENPQFLEMAAHVLTWAGAAYGLMHRQRLFSSFVSTWGARILLLMAAAGAVSLSLLKLNPVITGEPVPGGLFFNALLLAYLLPVPLTLLIARRLDVIDWQRARPAAHLLALVLLFAYVTLQTKRVFQGMLMVPESQSLAETYAYSAVWLAFALVLFVAGIRLASQPVRLAGLAVLALVVLKVFIGDMSNLEGLFRIASFVGLGLCLVGIGWLYQHFVRAAMPRPQPVAE